MLYFLALISMCRRELMFDAVWGLLLVVDNNSKAVIPPKTFLGERIMENHIIPLCLAGVDRNDK